MPTAYLDWNASAPVRPEAAAAMARALVEAGNPSSVHNAGRAARALIEKAREQVAALVNAPAEHVVFTSGGTEANALALSGFGTDAAYSAIEHDAVRANLPAARVLPVTPDGVLDLERADIAGVKLVAVMLANNETGVIQPVAEAAEIVHAAGGLIHCDAIQALGKIETSIIELDVDYLSLSAHKIGGPQGVGAFYVKPGAPFAAIQTGGGQEFGRRSGTENVAGVAGFAAAIDAALSNMSQYEALRAPRDAMEAVLKAAVPSLQIHGQAAPRVAGVSCFGVEGLPSETQVMGLDLAGFAVSAGSACSSGKVKPSRVLTAMGLSDTAARSAIRASFGWASKADDFDALARAWLKMAARARPELVKLDTNV